MEGTRISHYEILRRLGRGGMGEVYEAVDLDLGRRVALKFLAPELAQDAESLKRFEREARSAAALKHPHIATLHAFAREGGRCFIDMELVEGESLRERIRRGPLPVADALRVARDAASALAEAHAAGIVHRDVKPENLMFDAREAVKVMDFGLAQAAQATRLTMTGSSLGTPGYMAPEAIEGSVGPPADVFALGVMLHEMLAGEPPFKGDAPLAVLYSIANAEPVPLREARPDAPPEAAELVRGALAKEPAARPSAAELAEALEALIAGAPVTLPARPCTEEVEVERLPAPRPASRAWARHGRWVWALPALLGVGAVVVPLALIRSGRIAEGRRQAVLLNNRGMAALNADSVEAARHLFQTALRLDPEYARAMVNLAMVALRERKESPAESLLAVVLARFPRDTAAQAAANYNMGELQLRHREWAGAVVHLQRSLALDSSWAGPYNNLGEALVRAGRPDEARAVLERGVARFRGVPQLHKNLALAALALGDVDGALRHVDAGLLLDPRGASIHGVRAMVLARLPDKGLAYAAWRAYLLLGPDDAEREEVERELRARGVIGEGEHRGHPKPPAQGGQR